MARRLRIQFPGAIYHVLNRGDRREPIVLDNEDRVRFIETLEEACAKTGWQVHAFVLIPNHFHLVVETPEANLAAGMKWFLGSYTARFNRRHGLTGHLFSGRYKSLLVGGKGTYLRTVADYVHLNPARAKLVGPGDAIREFRWSSFPLYVATAGKRPAWLRVDRVLGECGIPEDSPAGRREFERRLETRRAQESDDELDEVRHGWCFGDDQFRQELLDHAAKKIGRYHYGPEVQESNEQHADRIVSEEMERLDWSDEELRRLPKGDPKKILIAHRLRVETTMTLNWVAERLRMGTAGHASHLLYWHRRKAKAPGRQAPRLQRGPKPSPQRLLRHLKGGATLQARTQPAIARDREIAPVQSKPLTDPVAVPFDPTFD